MKPKKIIELSEKIHNQILSLKDENQVISKIEKDILLDKIKKLYLKVSKLSKIKEKNHKNIKTETAKIEKPKKTEPVKIAEPEIIETKKIEPQKYKKQQEKPPQEVDLAFDLFSSQNEILAEKLKTKQNSVADKIKNETEQTSIAEKISNGKIDDLKSMIGINEKFLFINELFAGSMTDYTKAIEKLDQFKDYDGAADYLMSLRSERNWNEKHQSFDKLFALIERKYK